VFGIHGVGGIIVAIGTGIFTAPFLGGTGGSTGGEGYDLIGQTWIQAQAVGITIVWTAVVAFVLFKAIDLSIGLRVSDEDEARGLDLATHGEAAYHNS